MDGFVDDAHAAGAEFADDAVAGEAAAGLEAAAAGPDAAGADESLDERESFERFAEVGSDGFGVAGDELFEVRWLGLFEQREVVFDRFAEQFVGVDRFEVEGLLRHLRLPVRTGLRVLVGRLYLYWYWFAGVFCLMIRRR